MQAGRFKRAAGPGCSLRGERPKWLAEPFTRERLAPPPLSLWPHPPRQFHKRSTYHLAHKGSPMVPVPFPKSKPAPESGNSCSVRSCANAGFPLLPWRQHRMEAARALVTSPTITACHGGWPLVTPSPDLGLLVEAESTKYGA